MRKYHWAIVETDSNLPLHQVFDQRILVESIVPFALRKFPGYLA
jgi:hypothetical protein